MLSHPKVLSVLTALAVCAFVLGCGSGGAELVTVNGKLVNGSETVTFQGHDYEEGASRVELTFYPVDDSGNIAQGEDLQTCSAAVSPDGTFVCEGNMGDGMPTGKYKVELRHTKASSQGGDAFEDAFSLDNSPFEVDIQTEGQEIVLDIGDAASE